MIFIDFFRMIRLTIVTLNQSFLRPTVAGNSTSLLLLLTKLLLLLLTLQLLLLLFLTLLLLLLSPLKKID